MPTPTNGKDRLTYGDEDDRFDALDGNDVVYAGAGADFFTGGNGKDRLYGEAGGDVIFGGLGSDKIYGGEGDDYLVGGFEGENQFNIDPGKDEIHGGLGNDTIFGGGGKDRLYGDEGNDQINGWLGDDTAYGGTGDDSIEGGDGKDTLHGEAGNDTIDGGNGDDRLYGGDGVDIIYGDARIGGGRGGNDTIDGGDGIDYAVFRGNSTDFQITTSSSGVTTVRDLRQSSSEYDIVDGKDRLVNVERLVFEDKTITLSDPDTDATFAGANVVAPGELADGSFTASASIDLPDDVDIWKVSLTEGQTIKAFTTSDPINQPRTNISVYDANGQFLALNWDDNRDDPDEGYPDLTLTFTAKATGDYYFAVAGYAHIPTGSDDPTAPNYTGFSGQSGDYIFNITA
jgi:Ca2+-binding RTX toxin-like protein